MNLLSNPTYKDGKCTWSEKIKRSVVRVADIVEERRTHTLANLDQVVIPDSSFDLVLDFPLKNPAKIQLNFDKGNIDLKTVLKIIYDEYKKIYDVEEETSSYIYYLVDEVCTECEIKLEETEKETENCPICHEETGEKLCKTICNHLFHKNCIEKWNEQKDSCPICRSCMISCDKCNGTGLVKVEHKAKVIPMEHRDGTWLRNTTDGIYGIKDYDIDTLIIKNLFYDNCSKELKVCVTA